MNIFVTGGTGFVGKNLIPKLLAAGHIVWALARTEDGIHELNQQGAQAVQGSLERIAEWEGVLHNVDVVVHAAALVSTWGSREEFHRQITVATENLLYAASRCQVKRFIYLSSESVMQNRKPLMDIDEHLMPPAKPNSYYGQAKLLAERAILNYDGGMDCIILRPTFIYGPRDSFGARLANMVESGSFTWVDEGRHIIERVHVENVVQAIQAALTRGSDKGIYLITDGAPVTVRELFEGYARQLGLSLPAKNVPSQVAKVAAWMLETIWHTFGIRSAPPLNRFEVAFVAMPRRYRIDKARLELGYHPQSSHGDTPVHG